VSLLLLLVLALPARALNQRLYPLKEIVRDSECIAVGRVVAVDRGRMRAALVIEEPLKGTSAYRWIALNVAPGGWGHPTALLRRLAPGVRLLFFAARAKGRHVLLAYTNGTWFQMTAPDGPETERLPWTFTRCETYLRRTYAGTTAELETLLRDVTTGKREAPAPNPTTGPGMGPEVPASFKPDATLPALPDFVAKAIAEPRAGGPERKFDVRPLTAEEQRWVDERAKLFGRKADELALLLAQARYVQRDAQRALEYERDHGQGGNRAWVRSAEEILDLKQRSDRLSWLDVRGVLLRAGELFTPVNDPVELLHGLRTRCWTTRSGAARSSPTRSRSARRPAPRTPSAPATTPAASSTSSTSASRIPATCRWRAPAGSRSSAIPAPSPAASPPGTGRTPAPSGPGRSACARPAACVPH
jgi:hypothetical protein